jgi:hypothetical protein
MAGAEGISSQFTVHSSDRPQNCRLWTVNCQLEEAQFAGFDLAQAVVVDLDTDDPA